MRRRSRLEAHRGGERPLWKRYLLYAVLVSLSLALPAALTLRGTTRIRGGTATSADTSGTGRPSSGGGDDDRVRATTREEPALVGTLADTGAVSPLIWKGIAQGIPPTPRSEYDIHLVFSTDCSAYQNYQSIMLFNSAEMVDQQGSVTRVASGCTEEEQRELQELVDRLPERFRVHFTPDYSRDPNTGERYMFYNKPNGMAHFLKNANPPVTEAVIALIDPDMVLMSALTPYVGNPDLMLWHEGVFARGPEMVVEGNPVGQFYGLGGIWAGWKDLPEITEHLGPNTPARQVTIGEAAAVYPVGPPYMMHPHDWARLVDLWVGLSPKVNKGHPGILAEMYGFCIAAAHLRLQHRVAYGLMVSDSKMSKKEGWPLVEPLGDRACDASAVNNRRASLPPIVHYCQMYRVGTYMFGKRNPSHHEFFSCKADAFELPPAEYLASPMGTIRVHPRPFQKSSKSTEEQVPYMTGIRQGYAMCAVLRSMNVAQVSYKNRFCSPEETSGGVRRFTDLTPAQVATDAFG